MICDHLLSYITKLISIRRHFSLINVITTTQIFHVTKNKIFAILAYCIKTNGPITNLNATTNITETNELRTKINKRKNVLYVIEKIVSLLNTHKINEKSQKNNTKNILIKEFFNTLLITKIMKTIQTTILNVTSMKKKLMKK